MISRKTKDLIRALTSKGFEMVQTHHKMFWLYYGGKKTSIRTRISHSASEYSANRLRMMAKQLYLSRDEFDDYMDCPLSEGDYVDLLIAKGHLIPAK